MHSKASRICANLQTVPHRTDDFFLSLPRKSQLRLKACAMEVVNLTDVDFDSYGKKYSVNIISLLSHDLKIFCSLIIQQLMERQTSLWSSSHLGVVTVRSVILLKFAQYLP